MPPALSFPPELLLAAQGRGRGMAAAIFDVDGVLTDASIHLGGDGELFKSFSTLDGHGLELLARGGIVPLVITGRDSAAVRRRMAELGIEHAAYGVADKHAAACALLREIGVAWNEVAAIGDDWPDLPVLRASAFAAAPPGAHIEVRAAVHHVTKASGGHGAAREFCDLLLCAAGRYAGLLAAREAPAEGGRECSPGRPKSASSLGGAGAQRRRVRRT